MPLFKRPSKGSEADSDSPRGASDLATAYGVQRQTRGRKGVSPVKAAPISDTEEDESGSMIERILKRRKMAEGGMVTGMDPKEDDTLPVDRNNALVKMADGGLVGDMGAMLKEDYSDDDSSLLEDDSEEEEDPSASRASIIRKRMLAKRDV